MTVQDLIDALVKLPETSKHLAIVIEVEEGEIYDILTVGETTEHGFPLVTVVAE